jgi:hypothetical protein
MKVEIFVKAFRLKLLQVFVTLALLLTRIEAGSVGINRAQVGSCSNLLKKEIKFCTQWLACESCSDSVTTSTKTITIPGSTSTVRSTQTSIVKSTSTDIVITDQKTSTTSTQTLTTTSTEIDDDISTFTTTVTATQGNGGGGRGRGGKRSYSGRQGRNTVHQGRSISLPLPTRLSQTLVRLY